MFYRAVMRNWQTEQTTYGVWTHELEAVYDQLREVVSRSFLVHPYVDKREEGETVVRAVAKIPKKL